MTTHSCVPHPWESEWTCDLAPTQVAPQRMTTNERRTISHYNSTPEIFSGFSVGCCINKDKVIYNRVEPNYYVAITKFESLLLSR